MSAGAKIITGVAGVLLALGICGLDLYVRLSAGPTPVPPEPPSPALTTPIVSPLTAVDQMTERARLFASDGDQIHYFDVAQGAGQRLLHLQGVFVEVNDSRDELYFGNQSTLWRYSAKNGVSVLMQWKDVGVEFGGFQRCHGVTTNGNVLFVEGSGKSDPAKNRPDRCWIIRVDLNDVKSPRRIECPVSCRKFVDPNRETAYLLGDRGLTIASFQREEREYFALHDRYDFCDFSSPTGKLLLSTADFGGHCTIATLEPMLGVEQFVSAIGCGAAWGEPGTIYFSAAPNKLEKLDIATGTQTNIMEIPGTTLQLPLWYSAMPPIFSSDKRRAFWNWGIDAPKGRHSNSSFPTGGGVVLDLHSRQFRRNYWTMSLLPSEPAHSVRWSFAEFDAASFLRAIDDADREQVISPTGSRK